MRKALAIATLILLAAVQQPRADNFIGRNAFPFRTGSSGGLQNATASTVASTIVTPAFAGMWRISFQFYLQVAGSAGTAQMCLVQSNAQSSNINTCTSTLSLTAALGTQVQSQIVFWNIAAANIQQFVNFSGATGSPNVAYSWTLERLQ